MKVLHITPHLGGGVGKAHASLKAAMRGGVDQTFLLLEEPEDRRFADLIAAGERSVVVASDPDSLATIARSFDIVQFEFWNHPRLFECLARTTFPPIRSVFWSHISGLFRPIIQPGLIEAAGRFVFTTEASRSISWLATLSKTAKSKIRVINSGFGFENPPSRTPDGSRRPSIAYLGTVDFVKMHPGFFDVIDRLDIDCRVSVWGSLDLDGEVVARAHAMRHPERIRFEGQTTEPAVALSGAKILFYPMQPDHYGTAENALVEAMSLGLVPVVLNNPSEMAIVRHGHTGLVARSIDECVTLLQTLLHSPEMIAKMSQNAIRDVAETKTAARSAREFLELWQRLLGEPKRCMNLNRITGNTPLDWYLATQCLPGELWDGLRLGTSERASKGTLTHFVRTFPEDKSLMMLRGHQTVDRTS
jgi:glycosyltransferase involved in cell wall biosynthesis